MLKRTLIIAAALVLLAASGAADATASPPQTKDYIVVLKDSVSDPGAIAAKHAKVHGGQVSHVYRHALKGYSVTLPAAALPALRANPLVESVSEDAEVRATEQFPPRWISRIAGDISSTRSGNGRGSVDIDVAVIDSGIDSSHPELNVRGGKNCTNDKKGGFADANGHGTIVAGVIGARDNDIGYVGVAPGARLWSVRVLRKTIQDWSQWSSAVSTSSPQPASMPTLPTTSPLRT